MYRLHFFFLMALLLPGRQTIFAQQASGRQLVAITPSFPQRGQSVTISFHPDQSGKGDPQPSSGSPVTLVFTYSNLYELPQKIVLQPGANSWSTSFTLPRYATFATFYIQEGDRRITPPAGGHYELAVYKEGKNLIKNGYLYKAYSLSAQWGKSTHLSGDQAALYRKELAAYPDNYEARVRLYQYEISQATPDRQDKIRKKANDFIAAKFESDPISMGNLNYVTMGYLILGENSRLDSIRKVVIARYPHLPIAKELITDSIRKDKDSARMITRLEKELEDETPSGKEGYSNMHEILFEYYAAHEDSARALLHARAMLPERSPYLPEVLLHITRTLAEASLTPDTALAYAARSLQLADSFPAGIIRYFPETGYIPSYVSDSTRQAVTRKAKGNILGLMSMIYANESRAPMHNSDNEPGHNDDNQPLRSLALRTADSAIAVSPDQKTLQYTAATFGRLRLHKRAYDTYRRLTLDAGAVDTAIITAMKKNYWLWKGGIDGWDTAYASLQTAKEQKLMTVLRGQQLHTAAPSLDNIVDLSGRPVQPESLKGKVIVIDFWATWCVPCMQEMPYLQKVYDTYKNDPRVVFMVINSGARNTLEDAQNWSGNKKYSFPVYFHTNPAVGDVFGFNVIPAGRNKNLRAVADTLKKGEIVFPLFSTGDGTPIR
jgi:thiol-disulfide isomerase/thioredoxin